MIIIRIKEIHCISETKRKEDMIKAKRRWGAALGFKILVRLTLLTIVLLLYYYSWFLLYG